MRLERDSMGEMSVPDDALYGASMQRAFLNFPVSGRPLPARFIRSLGLVKLACARANEELGLLTAEKSRLIQRVAREIADGQHGGQFPVRVFQTGSGTSTNTNASEVIANLVLQLAGEPVGSKRPVHPNDDVNAGSGVLRLRGAGTESRRTNSAGGRTARGTGHWRNSRGNRSEL
jgi:fumarate hydratase class II